VDLPIEGPPNRLIILLIVQIYENLFKGQNKGENFFSPFIIS
jgi:hypothetical protein